MSKNLEKELNRLFEKQDGDPEKVFQVLDVLNILVKISLAMMMVNFSFIILLNTYIYKTN